MSDSTYMTFDNPIPAGFGLLTYTITDGFQTQVGLTVPANGTVQHPTNPASAPWNIIATLNGTGVTSPSLTGPAVQFTDPSAVITSALSPVLAPPPVDPPPTPTPTPTPASGSGLTGFAPSSSTSLLDSANWQAVVAPPPAPVTPPKSLKLAFTMQTQAQSQWCWAALTSSVWTYYAPAQAMSQCLLVNLFFKQGNCCTAGSSAACNQPYTVDTALAYAQCLNAPVLSEKLIFSDVVTQIVASKPIGIRVTWQGGGDVGHALCIVGYDCSAPSSDDATIDLKDPFFGESVVKYKNFPANYHNGQAWTHTYRTQACKPT